MITKVLLIWLIASLGAGGLFVVIRGHMSLSERVLFLVGALVCLGAAAYLTVRL